MPVGSYPGTLVEQLTHEIDRTPAEYMQNLLEIVRLFRQSITLKPAGDNFRQGRQEAVAGETMPVSDLWEGTDGSPR